MNKIKIFKISNLLKKFGGVSAAVALSAMSSMTVSAATTTTTTTTTSPTTASDGLNKITDFLSKIPDNLKTIGFWVAVIMLGGAAIYMMTGQEGSAKSKKWIAYICIGLAVLFFGVEIATSIKNISGNS